jgi:hypothetical protein
VRGHEEVRSGVLTLSWTVNELTTPLVNRDPELVLRGVLLERLSRTCAITVRDKGEVVGGGLYGEVAVIALGLWTLIGGRFCGPR